LHLDVANVGGGQYVLYPFTLHDWPLRPAPAPIEAFVVGETRTKYKVQSDIPMPRPSGKWLAASDTMYVRKQHVTFVDDPTIEALSDAEMPSAPSWKTVGERVRCCEEDHRVILTSEGTVRLDGHRPEHEALSAMADVVSGCHRIRHDLECRVYHGRGFENVPRRLEHASIELSTWFACRLLAAMRFEQSDQDRLQSFSTHRHGYAGPSVTALAQPDDPSIVSEYETISTMEQSVQLAFGDTDERSAEACRKCAKQARRRARSIGRLVACLRSVPSWDCGRITVMALCDAVGRAKIKHRRGNVNRATAPSHTRPTASDAAVSMAGSPAMWAFNTEDVGPVSARLWSLVSLADSMSVAYLDDPLVRLINERRVALSNERSRGRLFPSAEPTFTYLPRGSHG
jgi:hypothetical protein